MSKPGRGGDKGQRRGASAGRRRKGQSGRGGAAAPLDRMMGSVPLGEAALHRLFLIAIFAVVGGLAWVFASAAGVPAMAEDKLALAATDAGFEVRHIEVRGVRRIDELRIYEKVLEERDRAMPQVDLAALRRKLLRMSYVKDARVSRQLPDTLVIDIVERVPHAAFRDGEGFVLIDATGRELERVGRKRAERMLVVSGDGAKDRVAGLKRLLDAAPQMRAQLREAEWVGQRRWNLAFKSGQVLALPQGENEATSALLAFVRLDGTSGLIGGRVAAIDMRVPDRVYLRVPGHARELAEARAERSKAEAAAKAAGKRPAAASAPAASSPERSASGSAADVPRPAPADEEQ